MKNRVHKFTVLPKLPDNLKPLLEIAYNLWWSWNPDAVDLFRLLDSDLWEKTRHNPVRMLGIIDKKKLDKISNNDSFIMHMVDIYNNFLMYKNYSTWHIKDYRDQLYNIAYFSMEFGLHDSLPIYSGGLGVLSGCHIKSASGLGLPLVGIGLLYSYGNFNQHLTPDGWQMEKYKENDFTNLPVSLIKNLIIEIPLNRKTIFARVWKLDVGRVPIYFLDTNFEKNSYEDREITYYLYVGDRETRIKQEIVLGIGGMKLLEKLNLCPAICHMNEGHSAFLSIEKYINAMKKFNLSFYEAFDINKNSNIFTTHTPVPAGNEIFEEALVRKYLAAYLEDNGISYDYIANLGKASNNDTQFNMTIFALRNSIFSNGVSKLHGKTSRKMWQILWPNLPENEVPITHVTNGVHIYTWLSDEFTKLFDRYIGPKWREDPSKKGVFDRIEAIPDAELWRSHLRLKERLIGFIRERLKKQLIDRKKPNSEIRIATEVLEPDALTIGFARRFAEYKRAFLIFKDIERLKNILNNRNYPVQIIIAGKAHQSDTIGKEIIKNIINIIRKPEFRRKIVFIEDYDLNVAKYLIQGVDVWLNNPRRPLEASGTSGMKSSINGVLNLSVLDGWWDEAFNGENGWAIGTGEEFTEDLTMQDNIESAMLYDIIENEVVPLFYNKGLDGLPHEWIKKMKNSLKTILPFFNTHRMVKEYTEKFYIPIGNQFEKLKENNFALLKDLKTWRDKIYKNWNSIEIKSITTPKKSEIYTGENIEIKVEIFLNELTEKDILVEIYYGSLDSDENIINAKTVKMEFLNRNNNIYTFRGYISSDTSGSFGYQIRIIPYHEGCVNKFSEGLIKIA